MSGSSGNRDRVRFWDGSVPPEPAVEGVAFAGGAHLDGDDLADRFSVTALARRGPRGPVFRGVDRDRRERVTLEALAPADTAPVHTRVRIRRDIIAARCIHNPVAIVPRDIVVIPTPAGADVVVSAPWVDGRTLGAVTRAGGRLEPADAARVAIAIADVIAEAHALGVTHGGLGPDDVILGEDGGIALTGLGVHTAVRGIDPADAQRADVRGVVSLLESVRDLSRVPELARVLQDGSDGRFDTVEEVRDALCATRASLRVAHGRWARALVARVGPELRVALNPCACPGGVDPAHLSLAGDAIAVVAGQLAAVRGIELGATGVDADVDAAVIDPSRSPSRSRSRSRAPILSLSVTARPTGWVLWAGRFRLDPARIADRSRECGRAILRALGC